MNNEQKQNAFDEAMKNFNFKTVKDVMEYLNWAWTGIEGVPNISDMKENCKTLFDLCEKDVGACSTGGFSVTIGKDFVEIEFVIENSVVVI